MSVSCVVITKNEEANIKECLQSLVWCDEIIVIDDGSTDHTAKIAGEFTQKVFDHPLSGDFSAQRNFGLGKSRGDWVFFVDADERVSTELADEIKSRINDPQIQGFYLKRDDINFGHRFRFGETGGARFLRLARKGAGEWKRKVHEVWEITGQTQELLNPLIHYSHPTVSSFIQKINHYTSLDAQEYFESGRQEGAWKILAYPIGKFFQNYIVKQGFRDGTYGAIFAGLMSVHSFLTRVKLWILWQEKGRK